jgi:hypothetical protein
VKPRLAALASGVLFGVGLAISGMTLPAKVLGFLDVAGDWDPSLALVMAGAITVHFLGARLALGRAAPLFDASFHLPTRRDVDARLVGGAALFGVGWGLAGYCPGPALVSLVTGALPVVVFVATMAAGMILHDRLTQPSAPPPRRAGSVVA